MKKRISAILLILAVLSFAGCAKKTSVKIILNGEDSYKLTQVPGDLGSFSTSAEDNSINVTLKHDGVYTFVLVGNDGKEYTLEINYHNGEAEVHSADELDFTCIVK